MPYLNIDDGYHEHRKIRLLSDAAYRLHLGAMFFAAKWMTDGYLTAAELRDVRGFKAAALRELVPDLIHEPGHECGSEHCPAAEPDRYVIHDFLQWNKPRTWWQERRREQAERVAAFRKKKRGGAA